MTDTPPNDPTLEQAALGCFLLEQDSFNEFTAAGGNVEWFYDFRHAEAYKAIAGLMDEGRNIDLVSVCDRLRQAGQLEKVGGASALSEYTDHAPSAASLEHYAERLRDYWLKRQLRTIAFEIQGSLDDSTGAEAQEMAEAALIKLSQSTGTSEATDMRTIMRSVVDSMENAMNNRGSINGVSTGLVDLDRILKGMKPGQLIVLGGSTGQGKTSLAMNIAERAAVEDGISTAVFSLEMSKEELGHRMACSRAGVDSGVATDGTLSEPDIRKLTAATAKIADSPLHIMDYGGLTIPRLRGLARLMKQKHGIEFIVIDYLQLLVGSRRENRTVEVGEISRGIKALAKELKVPILALAQLNRDPDRDGNREPRLSDLRESGSIEQDADVVMFIHHPDDGNGSKILVKKNRHGRTGYAKAVFNRQHTRFYSFKPEPVREAA